MATCNTTFCMLTELGGIVETLGDVSHKGFQMSTMKWQHALGSELKTNVDLGHVIFRC